VPDVAVDVLDREVEVESVAVLDVAVDVLDREVEVESVAVLDVASLSEDSGRTDFSGMLSVPDASDI